MIGRRDPNEVWPHYSYTDCAGHLVKIWCAPFLDLNREHIARAVDGQCVHLRPDIQALGWRKQDFDKRR